MFVVKANPIAPAPLPPSCAPARGRPCGRQSAPAPSPAPRGNPIAGVRMACALRARRGMGDTASDQSTYKELNAYFKTNPVLMDSNPIGTFIPNLVPNIASSNLPNVIMHPVTTAQQIFALAAQTPGDAFSKTAQLFENAWTGQRTPAQYQGDKYALFLKLKAQGATDAQIASAEAVLDAYVGKNTPGLVGGIDPGRVPYDKDPNANNSLPWWAWALVGLGGAVLVAKTLR